MSKSQRIRDIFESRKKLQGHLSPEQRAHARNLEAGKGDAEHGARLRADDKRTSSRFPRLPTEIPYRDDQPKSDVFHITRGEAYGPKGEVVPREPKGKRSSLLGHLARRAESKKVKERARQLRNRDLGPENSSTNHYREGLRSLFEAVLNEASKRDKQRQANRDYWKGEGKDFKGAGRLLANLTKKFKAKQLKQPEKSPFRTPDPKDPSDWGIDPIPSDRVNTKPRKTKKEPDPSEEKMRSPHIN